LRFVVVLAGERIVEGVDTGDDEPDCEEETEAGAEVHEADLCGIEAVLFAVDGLEVGVEAVCCAE